MNHVTRLLITFDRNYNVLDLLLDVQGSQCLGSYIREVYFRFLSSKGEMVIKKIVFLKPKSCESLGEIFGAQDKVMLLMKMLLSDWNIC